MDAINAPHLLITCIGLMDRFGVGLAVLGLWISRKRKLSRANRFVAIRRSLRTTSAMSACHRTAKPVRGRPPARHGHVVHPISDLFCAISTRIWSRKSRPTCETPHSEPGDPSGCGRWKVCLPKRNKTTDCPEPDIAVSQKSRFKPI